jgi:hypothetical protein
MPLSWNEIRDRAIAFSREWADEASEDAEAKSFWDGFFRVFGVERRRLAQFEAPVALVRDGGKTATGYVDLFWKGRLLVEHKSRGKDLDRAYVQAIDYFEGIADRDLPRYVLVSDFARFRLDDLETGERHEFALADLAKNLRLFGFVAGYQSRPLRPQDPINLRAAERMGKLHDRLKESGYQGHDLEVLLVRLLFCLFADDTGIFPTGQFVEWLENRTSPDGTDLGAKLTQLFQVLDSPIARRQKTLDETLAAFPYVNGRLFEERLSIPEFDSTMRTDLLDAAGLEWSRISPAIFGALFQSVMDPKKRRNLGAHYTSEENILKLIEPLFLDDLRAELAAAKGSANKLFELQKKLRSLKFLDPACGCGNFLVVAYRELREIELESLRQVNEKRQQSIDIFHAVQVDVDQFFGIEIEEFPAQIAQVALWLTDHQMNQKVSAEFGLYFARLPLVTSPTIVHGNALRIDWNDVVPRSDLSYILGNPPFSGAMVMGDEQRADLATVFADLDGAGVLDFVACWYWKAAKLIEGTRIEVGFVSTNSLVQGEQVGILWRPLLRRFGIRINFAHRTFRWSNEAKGVAAVHCIIVGFAAFDRGAKRLFEYDNVEGEGHEVRAGNVNPYLLDAPDLLLENRSGPICAVPSMRFGSMPRDGGHLILSTDEKDVLTRTHPSSKKFIRPYTGAEEFLNGGQRWCLWLLGVSPSEIQAIPPILDRLERVRQYRLASKAATTRGFAATPGIFCQLAQPTTDYLLVPRVSSERRSFVPIGFASKDLIANDQVLTVAEAQLFHFGVMSSTMHMAWVRTTCGRLKSDFRYSKDIVYNNFPWPESPTEKQRTAIEEAAKGVLAARERFPEATLADLYDPLTMPPALVKAHQRLDKAVDAAYRYKGKPTDAERVAFLFELYQKYTSLFPAEQAGKRRGKAAKKR